jgi:thiosulfate/3-mercaptopyruvate sulfurtransferase
LVLYCGGAICAAALALALTLVGRDDVLLYDGSLQEWAADSNLPMTTGATPD